MALWTALGLASTAQTQKTVLLSIDGLPDPNVSPYQGGTSTSPADFRLLDLAGGREFGKYNYGGTVGTTRPGIVAADSVLGAPCFVQGAGTFNGITLGSGVGNNGALTDINNGGTAIVEAGKGIWGFIYQKTPAAAGETVNGVTFPANPGGPIFSNMGDHAASKEFYFSIIGSTGLPRFNSKDNATSINATTDVRGAGWRFLAFQMKVVGGFEVKIWSGDSDTPEADVTSMTTDVDNSAAGGTILSLFASGLNSSGRNTGIMWRRAGFGQGNPFDTVATLQAARAWAKSLS